MPFNEHSVFILLDACFYFEPLQALPESIRRKIKGAVRDENVDNSGISIYAAGAGVLAPAGSAPDGGFLKRNSGVPASLRASALAQRSGIAVGAHATIARARVVVDGAGILSKPTRASGHKTGAQKPFVDTKGRNVDQPPLGKVTMFPLIQLRGSFNPQAKSRRGSL